MSRCLLRTLLPALSLLLGSAALAADSSSGASAAPKAAHGAAPAKAAETAPDENKALYALGVVLSRNLEQFQLSEAEFNRVRAGFVDGYHKKPEAANPESELPQIQALQRTRVLATSQREKDVGQAYLDKAAATAGATKTTSGLVYIPVTPGTGPSPTSTDRVKVNYEGRLIDGTVFDSSAQHGGQPVTFPVAAIIPCWTEALPLMKVGGKSRIVCPSSLAYGDRGRLPKIKPGATLEFDIELVSIEPPAAAPSGPSGSSGAAASPPATTPPPR
ncbi:MAG TPA: FKBP-type peptidyl-prolyl cis-trans isomerase [Steroidobacteraceae bacterium]|jgi:FKBP-type peptidyl-prolyl cis-trans isomerase FkpA/FKBP-type peptidyl-prolyl cis-trans isomerase FklB